MTDRTGDARRILQRRAGRSRRRRLLKLLLIPLALTFIAGAVFLIHYYLLFDRLIREKLGNYEGAVQTEIYASPMRIYPGMKTYQEDFVSLLRRMGYAESGTAGSHRAARYEVLNPKSVAVYNDPLAPVDAARSVVVTWSGGTIASLSETGRRQRIDSFALRPELLSNAIDESRRKRRHVRYQELPRVLVNAILASEDRRFFSHSGIDPMRIIQALIIDIRARDTVQGASTLTQQFVKNYFLTPERTWKRKLTDAYMSILLEQRLSKEEIFELYCNEVYLGQRGSFSIVGVGEAAEAYFDRSVRDITLGEAATLAGIIRAPNRYAPLRYPDRAKARRDLVLDLMAEYEMISPGERDQAKAMPLEIKPSSVLNYSDAPYFVDYVQDYLVDKLGEEALTRGRYKVFTTLRPDLQRAAFEAVRKGVEEMDAHFSKGKRAIPHGTVQASLIAVDPKNGDILAMIGGRNYGSSQFNRITEAKRQPGSIFKPFVYAAAIETAYWSPTPLTPVSMVLDQPTQFEFEDLSYEPRNFKDEYSGQVTMRQAITQSLNVATIKLADKVGYSRITELAHRLGLNEQIKPYPAMAIGAFEVTPLEMVRAYTAFANGGWLSELKPLDKVCDQEMKVVFAPTGTPKQVLSPQTTFMITSLMQSVVNQGTGAGTRSLGFRLPAAGKTGTSHDGWFAGYTPDLLCIVWVGFDDNRELNLSGSQSALPIWTEFMKRATVLVPLKGEEFLAPEEGIVEVEIDPSTGMLATERCLERESEVFIKGTEPTIRCYGNVYEQMFGSEPLDAGGTPPKDSPENVDKRDTGLGGKKPI
ncbi:MAG: PBP1A family penicillin-binding protein [Acidobacteria bacterium]|nr:PBP1A family penicillin-binding protein [Acidobacteriota bacterium]